MISTKLLFTLALAGFAAVHATVDAPVGGDELDALLQGDTDVDTTVADADEIAAAEATPSDDDSTPTDDAPSTPAEGLTKFVAKLCTDDKKCCYAAKQRVEVAQDGSNQEGIEEYIAKFCVTSCGGGKWKALFEKTMHPETASIQEVAASGADIADAENLESQEEMLDEFTHVPLFYTVDSEGKLATTSCDSETPNDCKMQIGTLKSALKEVMVKTDGSQLSSLVQTPVEGTTFHHGIDSRGRYKLKHHQKMQPNGKVRLITTRMYETSTVHESGVIEAKTGDNEGLFTAQYEVTSSEEFDPKSGVVADSSVRDKGSFAPNDSENDTPNQMEQQYAQFFLQQQSDANATIDARQPQEMRDPGKSHFAMEFELRLMSADALSGDEASCALEHSSTQLFQAPAVIDLSGDRDREDGFNQERFFSALQAGSADLGDLRSTPKAVPALDKAVTAQLAAGKLTDKQYGAYLSLLAGVQAPAVQALLLKKLADPELQDEHTLALENGMMSLLAIGANLRDESVHRTLLKIAETSTNIDTVSYTI